MQWAQLRVLGPVLTFIATQGFMTLISMGLKECINLHIPKHSSDTPGLRRDRMTPLQVLWTLWLRCMLFFYASAVPALILIGPWGPAARTKRKTHQEMHHGPVNAPKGRVAGILVAEVILVCLAIFVAVLTGFMILDAARRLVELSRGERPLDIEKSTIRERNTPRCRV